MYRWIAPLCLVLISVLGTTPAFADNAQLKKDVDPSWKPAIGVRVGGYGFRQLDTDQSMNWNNCRMNGVGIYGTLDFNKTFYAEISTDMYHAHTTTLRQGLDRISLHGVGLVGARMLLSLIHI